MSVGTHYKLVDWNNLAAALLQSYQQFCTQAQALAAAVAPYTDAQLQTMGGFALLQDVTDLRSGANIAKALADLSTVNGTPAQAQANTASQTAVALGKFGGA